jgi:hypothetical protein
MIMEIFQKCVGDCFDVLFSVNVSGLESLLFSSIFFVIRDKIISGRVYTHTHHNILNRDETMTVDFPTSLARNQKRNKEGKISVIKYIERGGE